MSGDTINVNGGNNIVLGDDSWVDYSSRSQRRPALTPTQLTLI